MASTGQLVESEKDHANRENYRFNRKFVLFMLSVSAIAAVFTSLVTVVDLKIWVMFLAWTAFGLGNGDIMEGIYAIISMIVGLIIGMVTIVGFTMLEPHISSLALPISVFIAVIVVLCMAFTRPINNIPACFLGLSAYFASGMNPDFKTFIHLGSAIIFGATASALVVLIDRLCKRGDRVAA